MKIRNTGSEERIELQMTPMIDIVFQLLIFFIMTFKIVAQEGDFNVKMPAASPNQRTIEEPPPMDLSVQVYLEAGADGDLAGIKLTAFNKESNIAAGTISETFDQLNDEIIAIFSSADSPGEIQDGEVEIGFDFDLKYIHVINAISSVTGYIGPDGQPVKLVEKIKFAQPEPQE